MSSTLIPFLAGAFTTFLAFLVNQIWVTQKEKYARFKRLINLTEAGVSEVDLNLNKLTRVNVHLTECLRAFRGGTNFPAPPVITLFPESLQMFKNHFIEYSETSHLVAPLSELHFALREIHKQAELLEGNLTSQKPNEHFVERQLVLILSLLGEAITTCGIVHDNIAASNRLAKDGLKRFKEQSPFVIMLD